MFHVGLRHQDDEFVAAIAGHDIGTTTIRFEDVADALENEVPFEVSVKIIDELEAIEVHQYEGEGAARTRGAFPFGGKGFHEKAMVFTPVRPSVMACS